MESRNHRSHNYIGKNQLMKRYGRPFLLHFWVHRSNNWRYWIEVEAWQNIGKMTNRSEIRVQLMSRARATVKTNLNWINIQLERLNRFVRNGFFYEKLIYFISITNHSVFVCVCCVAVRAVLSTKWSSPLLLLNFESRFENVCLTCISLRFGPKMVAYLL